MAGHSPIDMVDTENSEDRPTEATSLLGAGIEQRNDGADDVDDDHKATTEQRWDGYDDFKGLPWWQTPTVFWLMGPYFLYTLAFGGIMVPKLELIVALVCRKYYADEGIAHPDTRLIPVTIGGGNPQCNSPAVQKNVAAFTLVFSALAGGLSAFSAPKLGSLSDRHGRKRLIVLASCGGIINEAITILAAKFPDVIDYRMLIFGAIFDGIAGSFTGAIVLVNSYVTDCTPPSKRGVSLGYLHACLFTGLALGPILAAELMKLIGSALSAFYLSLGAHTLVILFIWFFVPESLSKRRRMLAEEKHQAEQETIRAALPDTVSNVFGSKVPAWLVGDRIRTWLPILLSANPLAPLKMFVPGGRQNRRLRRNLLILGFIDTVLTGAALGAGAVFILYAKYMFNWNTMDTSRYVSLVSLVRVIVLLVIFPSLNYFFRTRPLRRQQKQSGEVLEKANSGADWLDIWLIRIALCCDLTGMVGYCLVRTEELFVLSGAFTAFGGLASATIQAAVTKQIPAERVGAMLGAMGLLHASSRVIGPILFDGIYAGTVATFPQAFVVVLASLFGVSVLASIFLKPYLFLKEEGYVKIPVRQPGDQDDLTNLTTDQMPSETMPRV
ncbi:MFS general substrate transporter [Poronia punctata]|nr:MFS general substrate transporter [Poronia punctata]